MGTGLVLRWSKESDPYGDEERNDICMQLPNDGRYRPHRSIDDSLPLKRMHIVVGPIISSVGRQKANGELT